MCLYVMKRSNMYTRLHRQPITEPPRSAFITEKKSTRRVSGTKFKCKDRFNGV